MIFKSYYANICFEHLKIGVLDLFHISDFVLRIFYVSLCPL